MFKPHYGDCIECNRTRVIIAVKKGYCQQCNYEKKQKSKSPTRTGCDTKDKKKIFSGLQNQLKKPTGEKEVFEEIAVEREWACFVTGKYLNELKASQFAHVLPKALNKYPLFKLYKKNIVILSDEAHYAWDFKPRSELKKDKNFDKLFELEQELKDEYEEFKKKNLII